MRRSIVPSHAVIRCLNRRFPAVAGGVIPPLRERDLVLEAGLDPLAPGRGVDPRSAGAPVDARASSVRIRRTAVHEVVAPVGRQPVVATAGSPVRLTADRRDRRVLAAGRDEAVAVEDVGARSLPLPSAMVSFPGPPMIFSVSAFPWILSPPPLPQMTSLP